MDLPPPPPRFRHHHNHLRYENVLLPPDFSPPPAYSHHLPPPPIPPLPHPSTILLPPPPPLPRPPPPMRRMSPPPLPRFAFSSPPCPIIHRSHLYEFEPPPKPYFQPTLPPPPLPPPPRENIPFRIVHDYPERYPVFEDEVFPRGRIDNIRELPENRDRNLRWGSNEVHVRAPGIDVGCRDRYCNVSSESFELHRRDDGGRWDSGIRDWGSELDSRRDYDERRWNNDMNGRDRDLFREHDYDERRWSNGLNDRSHDLYREGYFDERRWDSGLNSYELHCQAVDDEKRWESGRSAGVLSRLGNRQPVFFEENPSLGGVLSRLGNRQREFPDNLNLGGVMSRLGNRQLELADDDPSSGGVLSRLGDRKPDLAVVDPNLSGVLSRLGNRLPEFAESDLSLSGVLSRLGNKQPEFGENDLSLGRFSGRLGSGATNGEFNRPNKKKKSQKKNTLHRIQLGKVYSRPSGGLTSHLLADNSNRGYFKIKEKGYGKMQTRREDKKEREQSPVELAISFKSNSLVAKAIPVPSYPAVESCVESKPVTKGLGCNVSAFPEAKKDVISDLQSDSHGTSKDHLDKAADSGDVNVTANSARDLDENILKNAHPKVLNLQGPSVVKSGETHSSWFRKRKRSTEQLLLESNLQLEKDSHDINVDAGKHSVPRLKRESSMNSAPASPHVDDNVITKCSSRAEGLVTTNEDAVRVRQLIADEVIRHAHDNFSPIGNTGRGDSMGFNKNDNIVNKSLHVRGDGINEISAAGEKVQLESSTSFIERSSEDAVLIKGLDITGLSRPQDIEDNYFPEIHELVSSLKPDCAVMQISENAIVSDVGSKDANSEDLSPNQAITSQVMLDAKDLRSFESDAVTDCSNVAFDIYTSSCIRNIDFIEGSPEVKSDKTCLSVDNSFPMVVSDRETCLTLDRSSKVVRKRKNQGAQTGLSCTKANVSAGIVRSIDGEVTRHMTKDIFPSVDVDVAGTKDCSKKDTSDKEGSSGREDSLLELHVNENGSVSGYRKKQKFSSPRPSVSSLSIDTIAADLHSTRPSKCGAKQSEDSSSALTTINEFGSTDEGGEVGINDLYVVNVVDDDVSQWNHDLSLISSGISYPDRNGLSPSNSGDGPLASAFDIQTSSEELHLKSHLIPGNTKPSACLSDIEMICQSDNESNKEPLIADPNISCLGKYLEEALNKSHTNADIPQSLHKDTSQVVKKFYPLHGKLTWSKNQLPLAINKVVSAQHPLSFSNTRKLYPSNATKSRTWCRTGNSTVPVAERNVQPYPVPQDNLLNAARSVQSSYIRKGNSLVRKPSSSDDTAPGFHGSSCSVYRLDRCATTMKNNMATNNKIGDADATTLKRIGQMRTSEMTKSPTRSHSENSLSCTPCNLEEPLPIKNPQSNGCPSKTFDVMEERINSSPVAECQTDSVTTSDSQSTAGGGNSEKNVIYVKRRSYQLVATTNSNDASIIKVDNDLSDGYYKSRGNQLVRASSENHLTRGNGDSDVSRLVPHSVTSKTSTRRQSSLSKSCRHSKFSFVWKLHDTQSSEKHKNCLGPRRPYMFSHKRASYSKNLTLGKKLSLSNISQKLLVSRKRGAIYTRSSLGYSLRMSKVLSVGSSSLKWSKSIERNSKKANEEATRAVAAAEKRKKEEKGAVPASKSRNNVSRKWVLSVKPRPERIFRIGSERYKMDASRRTLHRITEKESSSSSSVALQSEKNIKRSYIPRRLLIGNEEYVRIGNGNQLVRDPKRRTRVLASEKVRWSLRTARLRLARKRKYCQFFTRFGKCNKDDGKCLYIHDSSKIVVCTKYLTGSCTNINCKLTHKVIPERMQDCSYFLKGSCSNENCPYRHVHVNPDSTVCESFLRGYCADGNECRKKHTYVCPAFEATGACAQMSTCKLHHPKKKTEKKPASEQRIVRGRYFDGGLIEDTGSDSPPTEKLSSKGNDDVVFHEGGFPDYIGLDVSDDKDEIMPEAVIEDVGSNDSSR